MKHLLVLSAFLPVVFSGCASTDDTIAEGIRNSPTGKLVRGEIEADEYPDEIRKANEESRAQELREFNREPTRAYNVKTDRVEYVPEDTEQYWSEENQRWEFVPVEP